LGIFDVNGPSVVKSPVKRVYSNHRAMYGTYPATRTFIRVNVAGVVDQRNSKIAWVALNGFYLTICDQVYV
jgi:hypothetical protein